ncbi:MAG: hypothetical protein LBK62_06305 [Treponema sp.]|nr:hypothetical protein [Treponema sp.]
MSTMRLGSHPRGPDNGMNPGYTGKPYNTATGLYNYGYRDYQSEAARFAMVDPIRDGEVRVHQGVYDPTKGPNETWQHFRDEVLRNPGNINTDSFPDWGKQMKMLLLIYVMPQCGLNIFGMEKSESMWESNKYCSDSFAETNISFYVNKLKMGHYYFNISFNPLDINKLRDNSSPIKFEYTVEIEKKGEVILKKTNSFFLKKL